MMNCPYVERQGCCGGVTMCHAVEPPRGVQDWRMCTRQWQWTKCKPRMEAWENGVKPFGMEVVTPEEAKTPTAAKPRSKVKPQQAANSTPCLYLKFKRASCKGCAHHFCAASANKRIMDAMLSICKEEPWSCEIYIEKRGE